MPNEDKKTEKKEKDEEKLDEEEEVDEMSEDEPLRIAVIKLQKGMTIRFNLQFSPASAKVFKFEMPFYLSYTGTLKRLRKMVTAVAVTPLVEISTNSVDFRKVVVSQGGNNIAGKAEIVLNNNTEKDINFRID